MSGLPPNSGYPASSCSAKPGSPADRAGIRPFDPRSGGVGDIIVAAQGRRTPTAADLTAVLQEAGVGTQVSLTIIRGEAQREATVEVIDLGA
jgi:2-alkenal reductase